MTTNSLTLLQDRSQVHTSKFLKENGVKFLPLPPSNPNLNPIENLFSYLKQLLQQCPTTPLQQLRAEGGRLGATSLKTIFTNIPPL